MPSGKFYQISVGLIVLSSDGTSEGTRCQLEVENIKLLLRESVGVSIPAIGGGRVSQVSPFTAGKPFAIRISVIGRQQFDDLKALLDTSARTGSTFTVTGTGTPGDFTVTAEADVENPYEWESFTWTRINNLVLRFYTT